MNLTVEKVDHNEAIGCHCRLGIDGGVKHIIRNDKTQTACKRVCIVVGNAMEFTMFHGLEA